ncbi:MAG: nucleotidyltransferase domain-containing protein [Fibromonadaceae bacterium]|jgi:type I restriction enzyme S subunit|nr:nucleotidyltransferase domain-containing protein [Fibromonadaceae bacterium]
MIAVSKAELKIIKDILLASVPDCKVKAFGSRTKNTFKQNSDLDLAVVGSGKLGFSKMGELKLSFEESNLPFRVDVLDYNSISQNFKNIIDKSFEFL